MAKQAQKKEKVVKDGGAKGEAIRAFVAEHGPSTRREIADAVGCTVGRVAEVARWNGWVLHDEQSRTWGPARRIRRNSTRKARS